MTTVLTSREFSRDLGAAKRAADDGPVFITDHGRLAHVLLTAVEYDALVARAHGDELAGDWLVHRGHEDLDLPLPPRETSERAVDLL